MYPGAGKNVQIWGGVGVERKCLTGVTIQLMARGLKHQYSPFKVYHQ